MAQPPWRDLGLIGAFLVAAGAAQTQISVNTKRLEVLEAEAATLQREEAASDRRLAVLEAKMAVVGAMLRRQLVWPEAGP